MQEALKILLFVTIIEGLSSSIGGMLCLIKKVNSKRMIASLYEITAGIMTSIVLLDMIPESINAYNLVVSIVFFLVGILLIHLLDAGSEKIYNKYSSYRSIIIISIAMLSHNITEGIAIGAGYSYSRELGISIAASMFLHNIPEGMVVGVSMREKNVSLTKIVYYCFLVGMPTGIGAFVGSFVGDISQFWVCVSLAFSAGSMMYIVAVELIPNSKKLSFSKLVSLFYIIGILIGTLITNV